MAVSLGTNCDLKHPFNKGRRNTCKKIQKCISMTCAGLHTMNPNVLVDCEAHCQSNYNDMLSQEQFLCDAVGPDVLFKKYGLIRCGFNPKKQTFEGQQYQENQEKAWYIQQLPIIGMAIFVLLLGIYLIYTTSE